MFILNYGKSLPSKRRDGEGYPVYGSNGVVGNHSEAFIDGPAIVVGRKGSIGEAHFSEGPCSPIDTTYFISEFHGQPPRLWLYFLRHLGLARLDRASAIPGLNRQDAYKQLAPVAPLGEQRRIVAKIEALQTCSETAKEALDAIPPLLEKFRQSVLAAAFRGDLTKVWRDANPDVEPASELLERIRTERRKRWIADAAEMGRAKTEGKARKTGEPWSKADDAEALEKEQAKAAKKYKEPEPVDVEGLPELPERWCWAYLGDLHDLAENSMTDGPFGSKLKSAHYVEFGVRVIRLGNLGVGEFKNLDKSYVTEQHFESLRKHQVFPGDLLIAALAEPVGRCCRVPDGIGTAIVKADCIRFVPHSLVAPRFMMHWMNSPGGTRNSERLSHGIGRLRINMANLRAVPVPLAPIEEQEVVANTVELLMSRCASTAGAVQQSTERLYALDRSILAKAFRGELVPQDPNDEPASALLERIRASRKEAETKKPKQGRGRKKK
ncbi:MAG: hypothetical protein K8I27_14865 [Planctomycetes bacterium]|nr:hypothetical protein [Planctomycetota bacterium]